MWILPNYRPHICLKGPEWRDIQMDLENRILNIQKWKDLGTVRPSDHLAIERKFDLTVFCDVSPRSLVSTNVSEEPASFLFWVEEYTY